MLKDIDPLELTRYMPTCRKCNQTYHQSHFISGNGPRYLICGRCAVEMGLVSPDEAPEYYSDELARARLVLYSKSCLLYTSPSPRDRTRSRMPSSA